MKNATKFDVKCAVHGWQGDLSKVMFGVTHPWYGWVLAHIKDHIEINNRYMVAMETHNGCPILAEYDWLRAIPRKQGSQPKVKRKPQKGSKPWLSKFEYVDYDPKLIAPGVKVKCRDKKVRVVVEIEQFSNGGHVVHFSDCKTVFLLCGKANCGDNPHPSDIIKILVEKQQTPAPLFSEDTDKMLLDAVLKTLKNLSNDNYCGYAPNVWYFWQGKSSTPPVDANTIVQIWCRGNNAEQAGRCTQLRAGYWWWKWDNTNSDIIAFRIVG